jgi:hypothetical protein
LRNNPEERGSHSGGFSVLFNDAVTC